MGESTKAICALLMIVSGIAAAFAWMADRPDAVTWGIRLGGFVCAMLMLGVILKLHFRADLEHDYLRRLVGTYFNRDDFCFAFLVTPHDGIAFMDAYFQTQRDQPCIGQIALRPARGFFLNSANFDVITFEVECPPAGFGFARIAIPIPEKLQGKRLSFEVGASVRYPEGKGRRVRFHDGIFLRSNSNFGNSFGTALTAAGAATGSLVLSSPATATIELPADVAEEIPADLAPEIKILWQLGKPPLENVG